MQETERLTTYDNQFFSSSLSSESGFVLPNISALFDDISQRDLENAGYYLYSKQNEALPVSFFGVTVSRLLSAIAFPLVICSIILYQLFHLKRLDKNSPYFPWIPLQKGFFETIYSALLFIIIPSIISFFLLYDERLLDQKITFYLAITFSILNVGIGSILTYQLSKKAI